MKRILLLLCIFSFASVYAQEKIDYSFISQLKDEEFNRSQVMDILSNLTDISGPRLTGSSNLKKAQEYAVKQLTDWGIVNAKTEAWGTFGKGWEIEKSYLAMTAPYYQALIAAPKAWTSSTNGPIKAQAVLMRVDSAQDLDNYKGKVAGKIVVIYSNIEIKPGVKPELTRYTDDELKKISMDENMVTDDEPPFDVAKFRNLRAMRKKIDAMLLDEKPALILTCRGGTMGTMRTSNGASYATDATPALPEMEMNSEHFNRLVRLLQAKKDVELEAEVKTKFNDRDTLQYDVVAEIPGTDKNLKSELVMLGAHLDSWHSATGTTDNGAGSAVMMEVMRLLKTLDVKPRRTIRLALWSGEEQGLLGSRGYVKNHFASPDSMVLKPEHSKLSAYYNLDNGAGRIRGIYLQGNDALRSIFETWLAPFKDLGVTTVTARNTGGTDHLSFDAVGLPGFQFIQDPLDYETKTHHTNMDTYDRAPKEDLEQAAIIIAAIVYQTAMRDEKLARKPLPKPKPKGKM
jgi:carboxypeptidase Q